MADSGSYFDFHHACIHHDGCYTHHWGSRSTCDEWFLNDMAASCSAMGADSRCYTRAATYYEGVRKFGYPFYISRSAGGSRLA